jgi:hypothetical protein
MIAIILPALLAGASVSAADKAALDAQVTEVFRPYTQEADGKASWDYPIWSAEVTAMIAHWQKVLPEDEPDAMNDGDWLCQCQDWNAKGFKTTVLSRKPLSGGRMQVQVKIDLGFSEVSDIRGAQMIFRREGTGWKLDDIFAKDSYPKGLKQALRQTIKEDEALRAKAGK